jgi:cytochrome c oxidase assembly protein subunit 15
MSRFAVFRRLALVTALFAYLQITLGAVVRVTNSGEGCPGWPLCGGHLIPPAEPHAIIEWSHRSVGSLTGVLIIATVVLAWVIHRQQRPLIAWMAAASLGVVALEGVVGALVVFNELSAWIVLIHLAIALVIIYVLIGTAVLASVSTVPAPGPGFRTQSLLVTGATYLLLLSGSSVVAGRADDACGGWPLCGRGFTVDLAGTHGLNLLHRLLAGLVGLLILHLVAVAFRRWRSVPGMGPAALLTGIALLAQVTVGYFVATSTDSAFWDALHVALATAVWSGLSVISFLSLRGLVLEPGPAAPELVLKRGSA